MVGRSFTFRPTANMGFGKVGFGNKPLTFVILWSFCTLAVFNTKDTAKARQEEFYFPTFPKPRTLCVTFKTTESKIKLLNKKNISVFILLIFFTISAIGQENYNRKFLFKSEFDTTNYLLGSHIELIEILPKSEDLIIISIDDRDKIYRSGYKRADCIKILSEYLTFQGDTSKSNKRYHFKPAFHMTLPEDTVGYTIQVEALYSFTRMLTIGYPPIRPTIVDRKTGEHLNTNLVAISEVYAIYKKWFDHNKKNDFNSIKFPLEGTPFAWLGEDKMSNRYFRESLFTNL
jgi:hypothetical protein